MAKCDLCGGVVPARELEQLLPSYRVDGIEDICRSCAKWSNNVKGKLLDFIQADMQKAVQERSVEFNGKPPSRNWLTRLLK